MRRCDDKRDQFANAEEISKQVKVLCHADPCRDQQRIFSIHTRVQKDFDSNEYLRQVRAAPVVTARCQSDAVLCEKFRNLVLVDCDWTQVYAEIVKCNRLIRALLPKKTVFQTGALHWLHSSVHHLA